MQTMYLFAAPVKLPHPPEARDLPRQRLPSPVLSHFSKNRPVGSFQESSLLRPLRDYPRFHDVEDEHAAGAQGAVHAMKELRQSFLAAPPVERIVDAFADRSHGIARRQFGAQKRPDLELCGRRLPARQPDHVSRYVDAEHVITAFAQFPRPNAAAAARVHHAPAEDAALPQQAQQSRRGLPGETGEARIVNVGQVAIVRRHDYLLKNSRSILAARMKSFSVRPSILCVYVFTSTRPQVSNRSGWCPSASATAPARFTNARAVLKSGNTNVLVR